MNNFKGFQVDITFIDGEVVQRLALAYQVKDAQLILTVGDERVAYPLCNVRGYRTVPVTLSPAPPEMETVEAEDTRPGVVKMNEELQKEQ